MSIIRPLIALIILAPALAGCIEAPGADLDPAASDATAPVVPPAPEFDFSTVVDPDHANHQIPALHTGGHGLALTGHTGIGDMLPPGVRGSITQIDLWGDYAVVSGMEGGLAFAIVDLTDPANPTPVSWWPTAADGWTARFSDDGQYVFYGCQMLGALGDPTAHVRGTCEDPAAPHTPADANPAGVVVIDVTDKANPKFVDFLPTGGSHNIQVASINGTDYVFTSAVTILEFDRDAGELTEIAQVPGRHDSTAQRHPVTGEWLLYTGTDQFAIYNVDDPANPYPVLEGLDGVVGWHEQTPVPAVVDGRVVVALAGETFAGGNGALDTVTIVDVTDPANPEVMGSWQPPFAPMVPWPSYLYSVHEIAATPTGQIAVSWYHGGVWVIDVSTEERMREPVTLAAYLPNKEINVLPSTFVQTAVPVVPFVWGAGWDARGYLVVPDMHTGVYVLEPEWGLWPAVAGGQ